MLRHHAGDLRVMMAGRVKTASEDGKAMHAPMLAAVREKRNWKFDGGGAWRELFRMKPSQLPLIAVALLLAGMVFIVFDRSQPVKSAQATSWAKAIPPELACRSVPPLVGSPAHKLPQQQRK
jgi:hypothetical protein